MVTPTFHAAAAILLSFAVMGAGRSQPVAEQPAEKAPPLVVRERERGRDQLMSVGASMKLIGGSYEKLREQIGDAAKRDENLRLINDMQRGAVTAKGQAVPADVLKHAADDAAKTNVAENYRKDLIALTRKLLDVETEIAEGKLEEARAHLEEAVKLGDVAHGRLPHPEE